MSADDPVVHPPGDYAVVEVLGHRTMIGRFTEVERFGTKMLAIEPIFDGQLLDEVLVGGSSIYQFTPCKAADAFKAAPTRRYQLPPAVAALLPDEVPALPDFLTDDETE